MRLILADWPAEEIREGDMFFTNDPWWGALHANDGILAMPIFWQGAARRLVGDRDARRRRRQPGPRQLRLAAPPTASARRRCSPGSRWSRTSSRCVDVERAYLRNSRVPEHNALNMRARVAALRMTHQRIGELIDEHGLDAFLAAQEGIIDYVERVVRSRLREIPDGEWYSMGYHDHDGNENRMYPICVRVIKRGDRLVVDLAGTSPQAPGLDQLRAAVHGGGDPRRDPDVPLLRPAVGDRARCATSSRSSRSRARSTTR